MATMRAVRIHHFGGSEQLELETIERPIPGPSEMLVRVLAASVNPVDFKTRQGHFPPVTAQNLPITLGRDLCGTIVEMGADAQGFSIGAQVYAMLALDHGGFAEYALVSPSEAAIKPRALTPVESAAMPLAALTAWQGLFDHGHLKQGQRVLIHGGAGGVGHLAVQFAKLVGAQVTTTVGGSDIEFALRLGADRAINHRTEKFETEEPFDLVFDLIGGEVQDRSWAVVKPGGALISTLKEPDPAKAAEVHARALRYMTQPNARQLVEIARHADAGNVKPVIDTVFVLGQARAAQERQETGHPRGKIVVQMIDQVS